MTQKWSVLIGVMLLLCGVNSCMAQENNTPAVQLNDSQLTWPDDLFNYTNKEYFFGIDMEGIVPHGYLETLYLPERQEIEYILFGINESGNNHENLYFNIPFDISERYEVYPFAGISPEQIARNSKYHTITGDLDGIPFVIGKQNGTEGIFFIENVSITPKITKFWPKTEWHKYWYTEDAKKHKHANLIIE